jgi:hypothetical protein
MSQSNRIALQQFLNSKGARLAVDGAVGPATRDALYTLFANRQALPIMPSEVAGIARVLGVSTAQVRSVAAVESAGGGFLPTGHPKLLWERHWFFRRIGVKLTSALPGQWVAFPDPGGYTLDADKDGVNDSWEKLLEGCTRDPVAAFESCSWGMFQIMGAHWKSLGYPSVFEFAWSMRESEAGHYRALAAFIRVNRLIPAMKLLSTNAAANRAFARGYNGPAFAKNRYDEKLADAMVRFSREIGA